MMSLKYDNLSFIWVVVADKTFVYAKVSYLAVRTINGKTVIDIFEK